jgi:hypothetical protein
MPFSGTLFSRPLLFEPAVNLFLDCMAAQVTMVALLNSLAVAGTKFANCYDAV